MEVHVLHDGYSEMNEDGSMRANCSCTFIKGPPHIIVDTMTPWDGQKILDALHKHSILPYEIDYVICTHGHSDHIGSNFLFTNAKNIVGHSISYKDTYYMDCDFAKGQEYVINEKVKVIPTPGHTLQDVTVIVENAKGKFAITGDLFEKVEDLEDDSIWKGAGSDSEQFQMQNREKILKMADFIVPGHGPLFKVPQKYKNK